METVSGALDEVARKRAEFAIVPYETAAEGPVHATIRALVDHELKVVEVDDVPFELHLMNRSGKVEDIAKVYVTPSDLACSEKALEVYEERLALVDVKAPALACQMAAEDATAAAVVSEGIGESYGLQVARRSIMDVPQERARFAIVGPRPSSRTGTDLTAVVFSVPDTPGALLDVLKQFAERGINLTKIQSRPVESGGWNYLFFVELVGHPTDRGVISAFEEVKRITKSLKVLGSYPAV
jgi:chorismate mutase/prephenate dehydratase